MRVAIIDDELPARNKLRRMLAHHPDVEVVGEAACGQDAIVVLNRERPDLALLDIQMPDLDGFGVLAQIDFPASFRVVFVTAYDAFAVRAFEVAALDYLLKPVDPRRFNATIDRARAAIGTKAEAARILISERNRAFYLETDQIDWIEADRNYLVIHVGALEHVIRGTLEALTTRLDPARFVRVSRSHVVRRAAVSELLPWTHGERQIVLHTGVTLTWTRRYRDSAP